MTSRARRLSRLPLLRRIRLAALALLVTAASSLTSVMSSPTPVEAQAPTPPRPLILIGGTFVPHDFEGYDAPGTAHDAPSWANVVNWLETEGGYDDSLGGTLYVMELERQTTQPVNWNRRYPGIPAWSTFVSTLEDTYNASTAGVAPIQSSVNKIKNVISLFTSLPGVSQVDIIGHSQGGFAARAAVRQMQEDLDPNNNNKVNRLISLGAPQYGVTIEQDPDALGIGTFGIFSHWLADEYVESAFTDCRDDIPLGGVTESWLPMCRDLFRLHSDWDEEGPVYIHDWSVPNPAKASDDTPPYLPWVELYHTGFFPTLNSHDLDPPGEVGPTPPPTKYYNLHSVNYPGTTAEEDARIAEPALYQPPGSGADVQNWTPQWICGSPYEVSHTSEWGNKGMRTLMAWALTLKPPLTDIEC